MKSIRSFVKEEFIGKTFEIDENDRTAIIRLFMKILRRKNYSRGDICRITFFLNKFYLSRAERCAIILSLGYEYSDGYYNSGLAHMKIGDYYDHKPRGFQG